MRAAWWAAFHLDAGGSATTALGVVVASSALWPADLLSLPPSAKGSSQPDVAGRAGAAAGAGLGFASPLGGVAAAGCFALPPSGSAKGSFQSALFALEALAARGAAGGGATAAAGAFSFSTCGLAAGAAAATRRDGLSAKGSFQPAALGAAGSVFGSGLATGATATGTGAPRATPGTE